MGDIVPGCHAPIRLMNDMPSLDAWIDAFIEASSEEQKTITTDHPLWWAVERSMFVLRPVDYETMWQFVLGVLARQPSLHVLSGLAAGPLEEMVAAHGEIFIDRIELTARRDPAFRHLLGGVWRNATPPHIWSRIEAARLGQVW